MTLFMDARKRMALCAGLLLAGAASAQTGTPIDAALVGAGLMNTATGFRMGADALNGWATLSNTVSSNQTELQQRFFFASALNLRDLSDFSGAKTRSLSCVIRVKDPHFGSWAQGLADNVANVRTMFDRNILGRNVVYKSQNWIYNQYAIEMGYTISFEYNLKHRTRQGLYLNNIRFRRDFTRLSPKWETRMVIGSYDASDANPEADVELAKYELVPSFEFKDPWGSWNQVSRSTTILGDGRTGRNPQKDNLKSAELAQRVEWDCKGVDNADDAERLELMNFDR